MIKIVLFDFDGVIDNNYELHFEVMQKSIRDITREEHRQLFEGNIHEQIIKLQHRDTGFDRKKHFSDLKKDRQVQLEVEEALVELSKKYTLGIITSAREYGVHGFLQNNDIDQLFTFVYGVETGKLKSEKFQKVMDEYNVTKDECIFVTDTLGDILEANQVGIKTIALDSGYHERERLERGKPFRIISRLTDIVSILEDFKILV